VRLVQITDTHLFEDPAARLEGVSPQAGYDRVLAAVSGGPRPDVILVTGDLTHDGSKAAYERLCRDLMPLADHVRVVPGNHDDPDNLVSCFGEAGLRSLSRYFVGNWQLLLLNSACTDWPGGRLAADQLEALERWLADYPDCPALIALHHQPVPIGAPWLDAIGLQEGSALLDLAARHPQVTAVLWGHVHQAYDGAHGPARLLSAPATSIQFQPGSSDYRLDDAPPGFRWLELGADGAVTTGIERFPRPIIAAVSDGVPD